MIAHESERISEGATNDLPRAVTSLGGKKVQIRLFHGTFEVSVLCDAILKSSLRDLPWSIASVESAHHVRTHPYAGGVLDALGSHTPDSCPRVGV